MKRGIFVWVIIVIIILAGILVYSYSRNNEKVVDDNMIVGNDRDSHGCIGSAGYSWCEKSQKCIRVWEEACDIEGEARILCGAGKKVSVCGDYIQVNQVDMLDAATLLYKFNSKSTAIECNAFAQGNLSEECSSACRNVSVKSIC